MKLTSARKVLSSAIVIGIMLGVTMLAYFNVNAFNTKALDNLTDVIDDVIITVPVSCNLTSTLDADHTDTINNGTYKENIGATTLKAYCNDTGV